jgi:putative FmdB family regulatory protein
MPIYEYQCGNCGNEIEIMRHKYTHEDIPKCGNCGGAMYRLVSRVAVHFKGDGWTPKGAAAGPQGE